MAEISVEQLRKKLVQERGAGEILQTNGNIADFIKRNAQKDFGRSIQPVAHDVTIAEKRAKKEAGAKLAASNRATEAKETQDSMAQIITKAENAGFTVGPNNGSEVSFTTPDGRKLYGRTEGEKQIFYNENMDEAPFEKIVGGNTKGTSSKYPQARPTALGENLSNRSHGVTANSLSEAALRANITIPKNQTDNRPESSNNPEKEGKSIMNEDEVRNELKGIVTFLGKNEGYNNNDLVTFKTKDGQILHFSKNSGNFYGEAALGGISLAEIKSGKRNTPTERSAPEVREVTESPKAPEIPVQEKPKATLREKTIKVGNELMSGLKEVTANTQEIGKKAWDGLPEGIRTASEWVDKSSKIREEAAKKLTAQEVVTNGSKKLGTPEDTSTAPVAKPKAVQQSPVKEKTTPNNTPPIAPVLSGEKSEKISKPEVPKPRIAEENRPYTEIRKSQLVVQKKPTTPIIRPEVSRKTVREESIDRKAPEKNTNTLSKAPRPGVQRTPSSRPTRYENTRSLARKPVPRNLNPQRPTPKPETRFSRIKQGVSNFFRKVGERTVSAVRNVGRRIFR